MYDAGAPCTPRGIVELLAAYDVAIKGAEVCIVERGVTVGRPLGLLLSRRTENATVTLRAGTRDLAGHLHRADIIVAAHASPGSSRPAWSSPGPPSWTSARPGSNRKLVGDVAPDALRGCACRGPNTAGGVGPMTRAMLLSNVVEAAERAAASA